MARVQPKLMHCFLNTNLRAGHDGLTDLASRHRVDVRELQAGQYVIFVNRAKDKLKLYAANGVLAYVRMEKGQRLDLRAIAYIPAAFLASGRIEYDAALREALTQVFNSRARGEAQIRLLS